jgi:uncharacterized protein (TIGR02600 family)
MSFRPHAHAARVRAFSLITVLAALAIMSLLLLALLASASHQVRGGQNDASLERERMLADTAVSLVIGQIGQATTQPNQAWISQPGLIRTYAATSARTPAASYKLYSAPQMIDTSGSLAFLATDVPPDWNSTANQSVYTDLNAPLEPLFGSPIYPILDVNAVTPGSSQVPGLSSDMNSVQMPVAWIYELQDGTLGTPSTATASNPIVGRIAFWTDDETSKIDINTAGEGSPWNTPRSNSSDDANDAAFQPASGEFERYPGHPAGVSLGLLFGTGTTAGLAPDALLALTPRYNAGGSEFGTLPTTATSTVTPKLDRLYDSVDELGFGTTFTSSGQRAPSPITPTELELARFVLTAHSHSPETTLFGEPRTAIWPVSDAPTDSTRTTAYDRAVEADATVGIVGVGTGAVPYYFQREDATNPTTDLAIPANATLFTNLINAGSETLPGYGTTFTQKYPGTQWPQLVLEMLDAIRGFNAVDPGAGSLGAPTSFVPYAAGDSTGVGRGLVVPLTSSSSSTTLRGLGRYPTLCGLTLVFYVSGYVLVNGTTTTTIDFETSPDYAPASTGGTNGAVWSANFTEAPYPQSNWKFVKKALVRAFVVPTTFQPGCGYPEVSDACTIQISGLNNLSVHVGGTTGSFAFPATCTSRLLSDALTVLPADRAWGGFEGPLSWRAAALDAAASTNETAITQHAFAGTQAFVVPLSTSAILDTKTGGPSLPVSWAQTLTTTVLSGLTVQILDRGGNTVQTFTVNLPALSGSVPIANGEADHFDGSTPGTSRADWTTNPNNAVEPSYYMTLRNRLLATQRSRPLMTQAGDMDTSIEPNTDLRLIAALPSVPANFFHQATLTKTSGVIVNGATSTNVGAHEHNLRFADGTSACFIGTQNPMLVADAYASNTASIPVTDWNTSGTINYTYATSPAASAPLGTGSVTIAAPGASSAILGDWDTGPGFAPDGALINLPDAGTTFAPTQAYQSLSGGELGDATLRSPNALIPSPVVFGSLPAGINPAQPAQSQAWRTLLFCPYPSGDQAHPGLVSPPDYLLLDRFWMPVVEPYGISTCLETAGKINLNDQIAPFTYIHRSAALRALLHDLRIPAISPAYAANSATYAAYKTSPTPTLQAIPTIWQTVNEDATITQIENRFATGDAYLTAGEICSVPLIPTVTSGQSPETFWTTRQGLGFLTGDNLRELPYAQIYNRLTTRSNSYTVHVRVQVLQKLNDHTSPAVWREGVDRVVGEWRGSYEIERYLDPTAAAPTPPQSNGTTGQPLGPYKFRIVSRRRFTP